MLEDLLTEMTLSLAASGAGLAVVCFITGWLGKGYRAGNTAAELKREIFEAKRSIPHLESNARNGELQITRLLEDIQELNDRSGELLRVNEDADRHLKTAQRENKQLTSEIAAIRGLRSDTASVIMDGFDDEIEPDNEASSASEIKLRKMEALYEKLKSALISRDEQIESLQEELKSASHPANPTDDLAPSLDAPDPEIATRELEDTVKRRDETIAELQKQAAELSKEKDMLEDLASRRAKSNRNLKADTADTKARIPDLEREIADRQQTITDREASIRRLLEDVESVRKDLTERQTELEQVRTDLQGNTRALEAGRLRIKELEASIRQRDEQIGELDRELAGACRNLEQKEDAHSSLESELSKTLQQSKLQAAEVTAAAGNAQTHVRNLERELEDARSQLQQREQWMARLKGTLNEREQKLAEQSSRADQLLDQIDAANQQARRIDDTRQSIDSEKRKLEQQLAGQQEKADKAETALEEQVQSSNVSQGMIADRDLKIEALENELLVLLQSQAGAPGAVGEEPGEAAGEGVSSSEDGDESVTEDAGEDAVSSGGST
jgi:chromosome segregation ATPase